MAKLAQLPRFDNAPAGDRAEGRVPRLRTRYYAFLSYSHKDKELADWLHRELEKFRVPHALAGKLTANGVVPRRLTPIFRDQHDLSAGGELAVEIEAALAASQFLVVLCSPTAASSRWMNLEIESFKRTRPEGCVLAAVASGEPFASDMPGREKEESFPVALRYRYDRRGHRTAKRAEPLAADFRDAGEGKRLAFLKLVAGMLGVGLDELVKREATGRHRRLAYLAAGSLAGMAVTSTLAVTAIQARNSAQAQRREAETLVEFMLGDLKDKLEPIGRLDALDGVGQRVLAYYQKQKTAELTDAGLTQRSRALSLMGQVAFSRGDQDVAWRLYREALAGSAETVRRSPDDPQRLFDHAQNIFWIGEVARKRGHIDQAEAAYREYKRLADRMVALQPDNLKWRMEVLYANEDLAIALKAKRRFAEAAQLFGGSVGLLQSLSSIDPANMEYKRELANLLGWFADAQSALGQLDSAIETRRREIAFVERLIAGGSKDTGLRARLMPAHEGLGILLTAQGKTEAGLAEYRLALAEANRLLAIEPNNSEWRDMGANAQFELAKNLLTVADAAQATQETSAACAVADAFRARDPNVARWQILQTSCLSMRARLAMETGASAQGLALADRALHAARAERTGDAVGDAYAVAAAYRLLGDLRQRTGDFPGATAAWAAGIAQLPANVTERPAEMSERAGLLRRVGRTHEAAPLTARLNALGYRAAV
jgi:eukaryotic-like serine/threonine-protein kinase